MISVVVDKRDANADELAAFDASEECQAMMSMLVNRGRKFGVAVQVHESGSHRQSNAAVEAIKFAMETDEGMTFLRLWMYGDFDAIRKEWPEAPRDVFVGADPLLSA